MTAASTTGLAESLEHVTHPARAGTPAVARRMPPREHFQRAEPSTRPWTSDAPIARPVRVMLVEEHPAVTYSVEQALADRADIALVATRASLSGAVSAAAKVDVAIVDHEREDRNGLAVVRILTRIPNAPKVLVLSAYADARMTLAAAISGSDGLVSKSVSGEELCQVVSAVAAGSRHLAPVAMPAVAEVFGCLTPIERLIAATLLAGADETHIAEILGVSEEDIDATCMRVLERTDALGGAPADQTDLSGRAIRLATVGRHGRTQARVRPGPTIEQTAFFGEALPGRRPCVGPTRRAAGNDPARPGTIERAIMQRVEVG